MTATGQDWAVSASTQYLFAREDLTGIPPLKREAPIGRPTARNGHRVLRLPLADAPAAVAWADRHHLSVQPQVRAWAQGLWLRQATASALSRAWAPTSPVSVDGLTSTLMGHQEAFVQAASTAWIDDPAHPGAGRRGIINADEPGLGKTIMALACLRTSNWHARRTVVVCPSSLAANWVAEMSTHFTPDTFTPHIAQSLTPSLQDVSPDVDVIVVGWAILDAWAATLTKWGPDALVIDEGHYGKGGRITTRTVTDPITGNRRKVKTGGTARADAAIRLSKKVTPGGLTIALTGTPIVNRPAELVALLEMTGTLHLLGGRDGFQWRFCDPTTKYIGSGRTTIDFSGASHLLELSQRLTTSGHYVRRTKEHLVDEGTMSLKIVDGASFYDHKATRLPWTITLPDDELAQYKEVEDAYAEEMAGMARRLASQMRVGPGSVKVTRRIMNEANKHLARTTTLRKAAGLAKVSTIVEWVKRKNAEGERVVVAAHHREVVDAYADALGGLKIQGSMSAADVEDVKRRFNTLPLEQAPAIVVSVDAGKTGHTLCKQALSGVGPECAWMVFAEQVWTPGDELQMHDRIWRIGQTRPVHIVNALADHTIDRIIYKVRARKMRVYDAAINNISADDMKDASRNGAGIIAATLAANRLGLPDPNNLDDEGVLL